MLARSETLVASRSWGWREASVALSVVLAIVAFHHALGVAVLRWARQEEYGHGFLIPVITLWLLWTRRAALAASIGKPSWMGPALIVLALGVHTVGTIAALYIASHIAFVLALIGIVLTMGGFALLRLTLAPILFLLFAIPVPYLWESVLTWRLQLLSSELGVLVIRLAGVPVYLEGNVIDLGTYKLQVVEACSGLRYLYPLLGLAFLAVYFFRAPLWQRVLVFLSAIPITILMNSLRIGIVGILVNAWGIEMAEGVLHFFEGWVVFLACSALLAAEMYLLSLLSAPGAPGSRGLIGAFAPPVIRAKPTLAGASVAPGWGAVAPVLLLAGAIGIGLVSGRREIMPERPRFVSFPATLGEWRGTASALEPQVEHALGLDDYILADYARGASAGARGAAAVNLYVAYYASQRGSVSPHSPIVCMPGGGWRITQFERAVYAQGGVGPLPFNRAVIARNSDRQLVYYWFVQRGRPVANEYVSKWYLLADALMQNRTDGALVRLTTPILPREDEAQAQARLDAFMHELSPQLAAYLPGIDRPAARNASPGRGPGSS